MSKIRMFDTPRTLQVLRVIEWMLEETLLASDTVQLLLHPHLATRVVGSPQTIVQPVRYTYHYDTERDFVADIVACMESLGGVYGLLSSVEIPDEDRTLRIPFVTIEVPDGVYPIQWVQSAISTIPAPHKSLYVLTSDDGVCYLYGDRLVSIREWNQFLDTSLSWYAHTNSGRRTPLANVAWVRRAFARGVGLAQVCTQAAAPGSAIQPYSMLVTSIIDGY
jgi:hypothetical protein